MKDVVSDVNDDARIQEAFSLFDKDNSGEIELDELGNFKIQDERVSWKLISSFRYTIDITAFCQMWFLACQMYDTCLLNGRFLSLFHFSLRL